MLDLYASAMSAMMSFITVCRPAPGVCCQAAGEFASSGPGYSACHPKLQMKYWEESFFTSTSLWEKWNVAPLFCLFSLWTTCWPSCGETAMWSLLISIFLTDCLCQSAQSQQGSAIKVLLLLLEGCQNMESRGRKAFCSPVQPFKPDRVGG